MQRALAVVSAAFCLAACSGGSVDEATDDAAPTQLSYWRENGPSAYRIVYSVANLNGMGGSPGDGMWDVTVQDGKVAECVAELNRRPSQVECDEPVPDPVGQLFFWLARFNPEFVSVTYDPEWQFPTLIEYDEPEVADEEYRIRVHRFEVLTGN